MQIAVLWKVIPGWEEGPGSPESPQLGEMVRCLGHTSVLSCVLGKQAPQVKYPTKQPKASAKILTAEENLQLIAEKERKKKLEEEEKQRKRMKREERRLQAEEEKKRKSSHGILMEYVLW